MNKSIESNSIIQFKRSNTRIFFISLITWNDVINSANGVTFKNDGLIQRESDSDDGGGEEDDDERDEDEDDTEWQRKTFKVIF